MGATTFEKFVKASDTICSANSAFRKAVEDAMFEHGHGHTQAQLRKRIAL